LSLAAGKEESLRKSTEGLSTAERHKGGTTKVAES
jgi:hypothetical protein